jgi:hypothetical protein
MRHPAIAFGIIPWEMSVPQNPLRLVDERGFQSARNQRDQTENE